jgi:farnesyl diphosphate synthase
MEFSDQLTCDAGAAAAAIDDILRVDQSPAQRLRDAMIYATMSGGKRLRAALVLGAARLSDDAGDPSGALRVAAALEMLHAYSLVHDDLPCMDDDSTRRGQPTVHDDLPAMDDAATRRSKPSCHLAFDEATAILAGDALQTMAFDVLADGRTHSDPAVQIRLVAALAGASGLAGMAGGQMLDLQAETRRLDLTEVTEMQSMKTGALIRCAAICGGIVGGADARLLDALGTFSRDLGLAFQIADDLLDYDGDAATLGKPAGQDAERGKGSFVSLMGADQARTTAHRLIDDALAVLAPWPQAGYLGYLATFAIARNS